MGDVFWSSYTFHGKSSCHGIEEVRPLIIRKPSMDRCVYDAWRNYVHPFWREFDGKGAAEGLDSSVCGG